MCEAVGMSPKVHWRLQEVGDTRNLECQLRNIAVFVWNWPKREDLCGAEDLYGKAIGMRPPLLWSSQFTSLCSGVGYGAPGHNVYCFSVLV